MRTIYRYLVYAYTDVGLFLISVVSKKQSISIIPVYVANLVSQDCVQLPSHYKDYVYPLGIVTRTENGVVLGYKVVLLEFSHGYGNMDISLLIYSSETGVWSFNIVHLPFPLYYQYFFRSVSLNGNLYWFNRNSDNEDVVVSHDFCATGTDSDTFFVTLFPDSGKHPKFRRACTVSQGFLMYMNVVSDKLKTWRLIKSGEWQPVSEIYADFINPGFDDHIPLSITNPFNAKSVYFWSKKQKQFILFDLCNGKFVLHSELEHSGRSLSSVECPRVTERSHFSIFVLPQRLHLNRPTESLRSV